MAGRPVRCPSAPRRLSSVASRRKGGRTHSTHSSSALADRERDTTRRDGARRSSARHGGEHALTIRGMRWRGRAPSRAAAETRFAKGIAGTAGTRGRPAEKEERHTTAAGSTRDWTFISERPPREGHSGAPVHSGQRVPRSASRWRNRTMGNPVAEQRARSLRWPRSIFGLLPRKMASARGAHFCSFLVSKEPVDASVRRGRSRSTTCTCSGTATVSAVSCGQTGGCSLTGRVLSGTDADSTSVAR